MGLSRNKVAVPEGAAGSPPFYGVFVGARWCPVFRHLFFSPPFRWWGCLLAWKNHGRFVWCVLLGSLAATAFPFCVGLVWCRVSSPRSGSRGFVPVWLGLVGWWFENWIVDASIRPRGGVVCSYCDSNPRARPFRVCVFLGSFVIVWARCLCGVVFCSDVVGVFQ